MLDVEVKMSLPIYKPQSERESSEKSIDSPRSGSDATSDEQTIESEQQEESSQATTTDEVLEEDQEATQSKQLLAETLIGSDSTSAVTHEGTNDNRSSENQDSAKAVSSDVPLETTDSTPRVDTTNETLNYTVTNEYPSEQSDVTNSVPQYTAAVENSSTPREQSESSRITTPNVIEPNVVPVEPPAAIPNSGTYVEGSALHHDASIPRSTHEGVLSRDPPPATAHPQTEPFSWYQAPYNYSQYSQYQQYPQSTNQQYNNNYQDYSHYPQYSQYSHSQYPQYPQYPSYTQHHTQDPYWSSNGHTQHHHKPDPLPYQKIDELHVSLMKLKDEATASRETLSRLERLEHKVEFIMDYLKHKLIQNDTQEKNSRDEANLHLKKRLVKMQDAIKDIENRFTTPKSSEEEIEIKDVNISENKLQKK